MKKLMLINNNVYTFVSGILISLSTNIFTSLCFEKSSFFECWYLYGATIAFLVSSIVHMYLAAKLSKFQNYIIEKRVSEYNKKLEIVSDATKNESFKYVISYTVILIMFLAGVVLLTFNYI